MIIDYEALSFQIKNVVRARHSAGAFRVESPPCATFSLCVSGRAAVAAGDRRFAVKAGDVLFLPAGVPIEVENSVSEGITVIMENCNFTEAEHYRPRGATEVTLLFIRALAAFCEHHSVNGVKAAVYTVLERLEAERQAEEGLTAFERCLRYMDEHFCDPELDIAAVCKRGFTSVSSLQRAFVRRFGLSPMQYVIGLRMGKAARLLGEGSLTVKEIALACGFQDEKYFSRAFKKHYGYSPSHLREEVGYLGEIADERHFARMLMSQPPRRSDTDAGQ